MPYFISNKSDEELWALLRKSNKDAFALLYQRHIEGLFNFALKLTTDQEIIKDTIQELFIEFWNKRNRLSEVKQVKIYLIKSLRYKLFRAIAKANKTKTYDLEKLLADIPDHEPSEKEIAQERRDKIKAQLRFLSERQREVIHLRYFQNLKHEEIAEIMNMNYQSVCNLLNRALKKLRKHNENPIKTKKTFQK